MTLKKKDNSDIVYSMFFLIALPCKTQLLHILCYFLLLHCFLLFMSVVFPSYPSLFALAQTKIKEDSLHKPFIDTMNFQTNKNTTPHKKTHTNYSIIHDLRKAFEPYSQNNQEYKDFAKEINTFTKIPTFESYRSMLYSFHPHLIILKDSINSFDMMEYETSLQTTRTQILDTLKQEQKQKEIPKQIQDNIQKTTESNINLSMLAPKCINKKFNIKKEVNLDIKEILYTLAKQCSFSIQYIQGKLLNDKLPSSTILNIENKPLDFVLELLLHNVFYKIDSNVLVIKDFDMQIFELNYISSTRMAQSNTDVLFSQEQQNQNSLYNGSQGFPNFYQNTNSFFQNPTQNPNISYFDNMSLKNQLRNQIGNTTTQFGKSGTKIYSIDENNFWADIETKLQIMLNEKAGDKFMIDKNAGLISVWTTKYKMQEVETFLSNLENKMNLQVAIDVEILSLLHFTASNIGIDWKEIFSILNPQNSKLNLNFGLGGTSLTLGNNNTDLNNIFNLLKTYGDLRSLSNPKIMALNNQPAIISVGSVLRYSKNLVYQSNNTNNTIQNTSTEYPSIFSGILLDITPSINHDSVILRINPSITKTKDPDIENAPQALNSPPNLSTNQLSSIVKLKDGERVIIGGLLNNVSHTITQGIPKIGEKGPLKRIFGKENKAQRNEELIIIITPHIIKP